MPINKIDMFNVSSSEWSDNLLPGSQHQIKEPGKKIAVPGDGPVCALRGIPPRWCSLAE